MAAELVKRGESKLICAVNVKYTRFGKFSIKIC